MVAEVAHAVLEGRRTRHATIRQKKSALVAFPATRSFLSTDVQPHGKIKTAEDKSDDTMMKKKHVGGKHREKNEDGCNHFEEEEWSSSFPGFLVVVFENERWVVGYFLYPSLVVVVVGCRSFCVAQFQIGESRTTARDCTG
jgi:hypothetical protein